MSEEITPANAVEIAKRNLDSVQWRANHSSAAVELVYALVARIEASNATFRKHLEEDCIPNYFQQQRDSAVARVRQLEEQHVAAVAMLKSISVNRGDEHDYAVDALIGIERSLAVLDAEETT